jgi:hypothetical protein
MEGYNTLYLSLMLGSNALYQEGPWGRFVETLDMLSASSIDMFKPKEDPLVVVALSPTYGGAPHPCRGADSTGALP